MKMKSLVLVTLLLVLITGIGVKIIHAQQANIVNSIARIVYVDSSYYNNDEGVRKELNTNNGNTVHPFSNVQNYNALGLHGVELIYIALITLILLMVIGVSITAIYKHAEKTLYEE